MKFFSLLLSLCLLTVGLARAAIECTPDHGKVEVAADAEFAQARFILKNTYAETAFIDDVVPSCDCVTVTLPKRKIPPGESLAVTMEIDLRGRTGPQSKTAELIFKGIPLEQLTLSLLVERREN